MIDKACGVRKWTKCIAGPPNEGENNISCFGLLCYLSVSGACISLQVTKVTGGVLQTEASLVSLCHFTASADLQ